jgi:hypothetical protein
MKSRIVIPLVILGLAYLTLPSRSFAEHDYEIIVTIGDTTLTSLSPHTSINIPNQQYTHAASGGTVTIANSNGTARVEQTPPIADGTNDALRIINLKITANTNSVTNFPITFKRKMTQNPVTPPALYYKTTAIGTFEQASGSSVLWGQYVKNPLTEGFLALGSMQFTPGLLSFNYTIRTNHQWPTPPTHANMSGDRVLKVEFTFNLANGKSLDLKNGISMFSSLSPDPDPACASTDPDCAEPPPLILPSVLKAGEVIGKRDWFCRVFDWWCPE